MDALSRDAFRAYRDLVYETDGFTTVFHQMTPLAEITELNIGSRPASRTSSDRIEDLRAIPWVFSWAQARVMLPGWYGVGHALTAFQDQGLLREMLAAWPFFQTTLDNLEMVLAKSDMAIAERYVTLVEDHAASGTAGPSPTTPSSASRSRRVSSRTTRRSRPRSACGCRTSIP
jgi:phosphoenolpyruvate carboxylase